MQLLDQTTFASFISASDKPAVVKFYADWCKDCRAIRESAEQLAGQYDEHFHFAQLDTAATADIPASYRVRGIPTIIAFLGGQEIGRTPAEDSGKRYITTGDQFDAFLQALLTTHPRSGAASTP